MGIIKDTLFGGAEKKAAQAQSAAADKAMAITKEGVTEAKNALNEMSPLAMSMLGGTAQQGLDLMAAGAPQAAELMQSGNVGAQDQLASALPLIQAALMGQPIDFSKIQSQKLKLPDMGFLKQKLPNSINVPQPVAQQQPTQQPNPMFNMYMGNQLPNSFSSYLGGTMQGRQLQR